jgi:flavin-dependent dehydrogenase
MPRGRERPRRRSPRLDRAQRRWIVPAGALQLADPSLREAAIEREEPSGARWLLLGDAGGMVDPITREGIFRAVAGDAAADGSSKRVTRHAAMQNDP